MKKILLAVAVMASVAFGSCSKADKAACDESCDLKAKIENCSNPDSIAVYVEKAQAYAQKLAEEGKIDEAKKYLAEIQPVVEEKAPALAGTFATIKAAVDQLPSSVEAAKDAAVDSLENAGKAAVDSAKTVLNEKATEAADKAKAAADAAAADAAGKAKAAADDATKSAKDKLNNMLK